MCSGLPWEVHAGTPNTSISHPLPQSALTLRPWLLLTDALSLHLGEGEERSPLLWGPALTTSPAKICTSAVTQGLLSHQKEV